MNNKLKSSLIKQAIIEANNEPVMQEVKEYNTKEIYTENVFKHGVDLKEQGEE